MNFRQTAILIGAVFAVVVVLLILTFTAEDKSPATEFLTEELAGAKPEDIDTVEMERDTGGRLKMVRAEPGKNKWEIVEPFHAPADGPAVQAIITALMKAKPTASSELTSNPAVHGLEPPSMKITLREGNKASTVNLGDVTIGGSKALVFVTTSARSRPMAVPRGELDSLFRDLRGNGKFADLAKWIPDFRVKNVFPSDPRAMGEDVASLKLDLPNKKKELALSRNASGGWKFDVPAGWGDADYDGDPAGLPNTFTGVGPLLRALTNVTAASSSDFIDNPKDLKDYGLNPDNPDLVRVEMKTKDGQTAVVYFGKIEAGTPPPPIPGTPPQPHTGTKVYVRIEGQPGVIRASATGNLTGLAPVITDPNPLRDRDLLHAERNKKVDGFDILLPGQPPDKPTKLRKVGNDWKLYGGPHDPQNASTATVAKLVDLVSAKRVIKDFIPVNPADFSAVAATLYVWAEGFTPPPPANPKADPVKKAEPTKLEFGRVQGETIYVRRTLPGGQVDEFTLPTSIKVGAAIETLPVLATVAKTRLDFLDRSLPSFSDTTPTRIAATGSASYTLAHDEKPDPVTKERLWRFVAPDPRAGQVADGKAVRESIIYYLANLSSMIDKFVDEDPTPAKLAEYGFTPNPRLKVTVDLPPETAGTKQLVFEFGKDTADPDKVYARVGGRAAVFTVARRAYDQLTTADLRDRVVFRNILVPQVNSLELTGWGGITLKFEKNKDGAWVAQPPTPPAFMVDPTKVNAFINLLATTPVKTFEKGAPEPKHGFGDPKISLIAKVKWPGGEAYVNLGASPDGGASYYGWTTSLPAPNQIFTIDAAPFKPYKESSGGFAK